LYPIKDASGKVTSVAVYARDITAQRSLTEALRVSEEKYRTLAETALEAIFILDRNGHLSYVNSFGANYLGLKPEHMEGHHFLDLVPVEHWEDTLRPIYDTGEPVYLETENKLPTGTVWFGSRLVPLKNASGEITSILGVARDITNRKKTEDALRKARSQLEARVAERTRELSASREQLRLLTAQIVNAQEEERRSISRELHDEAGQALITLKYDLAAIQGELSPEDTRTRGRITDSMGIIDQTMQHIRELAHSLRPPVLEVGGINLSLQDHCQELSERTRIPISYQGMDIPGLPDEIGISLFRVAQEALTNIMKHAGATHVDVRLQYGRGDISLSVVDNGRGFVDADQKKGLGLLGIEERLHLIGGRLEILSPKKGGTKLIAHVPWNTAPIE
jgi:PAS domain S-box-containing protein